MNLSSLLTDNSRGLWTGSKNSAYSTLHQRKIFPAGISPLPEDHSQVSKECQ